MFRMIHASGGRVTRGISNSLFCIEWLREFAIGMPTSSHLRAGLIVVAPDVVSNFRQQATHQRDISTRVKDVRKDDAELPEPV